MATIETMATIIITESIIYELNWSKWNHMTCTVTEQNSINSNNNNKNK